MIYLDNHSASRPCASTLEWMKPYLFDHWGAGFASHRMGQEIMAPLEHRYRALYDLAGASLEDTCVFTSSGAEAVNQVLWSVFTQKAKKEGQCHFITSPLEDAPTTQMLQRLEELGCFVKIGSILPSGQIDLQHLASLISPRTALVSITAADGLTGALQPIEELAALCKEQGVLLHLDVSYAIGKLSLSFADWGVDYLTFSGDKMHALKSSGALFAKKGAPLFSLILGGSEQGGLRGGAFDVASFMGLAAAAIQSQLFLDRMGLETARLRDLLEEKLVERLPGTIRFFADELRLPNVSLLAFPRVHPEALLYILNQKGVLAGPSKENGVSFALSRYTTEEEILRAIDLIVESVLYLQPVSEALF